MNWCCVQWETLADELKEAKLAEIDRLIDEKDIPASVFATIKKLLSGMDNHCPLCGTALKEETVAPRRVQPPVPAQPVVREPDQVRYCRPCGGRGKVAGGLNCTACLGEGRLLKKNRVIEGVQASDSKRFDQQKYQQGQENISKGKGVPE